MHTKVLLFVRFPADVLLIQQTAVTWEYLFIEEDNVLDELVHLVLVLDLVLVFWHRHKRWSETDGQVIWIHHVLITEL